MAKREEWGSRFGFILAAVGSAVGLGNVWRFPYQAYDNGGGAFLVPYFIALLTAGIPLLILEFGLGHKYKGCPPAIFRRLTAHIPHTEKWEWLGWFQTLICFCITLYYAVILGWTLSYIYFSFNQSWGSDPKSFFFSQYLVMPESGNPLDIEFVNMQVFVPLVLLWGGAWFIMVRGVQRGLELASKIFMPLLTLLLLVITIRCVFLDGALQGVDWLFKPDFSRLREPRIWTAAYGQIFYSLSIGFGIMLTYSSYLPKKSDLVNNAFITGLLNSGFSLVSGILIFSILGNMALQEGVPVPEVVSSGIGLAFITIPQALSLHLPWPGILGPVFFACLFLAGFLSLLSLVEPVLSSVIEKMHWTRRKTTHIMMPVFMLGSLLFATNAGLLVLDIFDHFLNNIGLLASMFFELLIMCWFFKTDWIRDSVNPISEMRVGLWWAISLKYITFILLFSMLLNNIVVDLGLGMETVLQRLQSGAGFEELTVLDLRSTYGGYSTTALFILGWVPLMAIGLAAFLLQHLRRDELFKIHEDTK
ncbi:MAG: sodium-dependent transporter [Spartobacteria bacterium]|nr:sodium-dependent transporter [Spartobacteria bacterium]